MSKPAPKKRKASKVTDGSSGITTLDLSKSNAKKISASLLTLLPDGATRQHEQAKKLTTAFTLVMAGLDERAISLARASESDSGPRLPITFKIPAGGKGKGKGKGKMTTIHIPEDPFMNILRFLNGREVVNISLVNKAWLSASRLPNLWERLDKSSGLINKKGKTVRDHFVCSVS